MTPDELEVEFERIASLQVDVHRRLEALKPTDEDQPVPPETIDLLDEIRLQLDQGLSDLERQQIAALSSGPRPTRTPSTDGLRPGSE